MSIPRDHGGRPDEACLSATHAYALTFAGALLIFCAQPVAAIQAQPTEAEEEWRTPADANDLYVEGNYEKAIEVYRSLMEDPRDALEAELGIARCRLQIGAYDEAVAELVRVDAVESEEWHYLLARLYQITGRYDELLSHARAAYERRKDHAGARLLYAQTLEGLGRRDEAIEAYQWFDRQVRQRESLPRDAAWVTSTAVGFLRYSVLTRANIADRTRHVLNEMLQVAYGRLDRTFWPARLAAADLLREKYNNDEEDGSLSDYRAALRINPRLPSANVGIGLVYLEGWDFERVEAAAEAALEVNPRFAPAHCLLAAKFIVERRYEQAVDAAERAMSVNPRDIEALSIIAAARACQFDEDAVEHLAARVAEINPRSVLFYRTLGDALGGIRQYAASEDAYRKAIEYDPTDANARTELGMMYMQWGHEEKARDALQGAWALDAFNERTLFTLELLETLEKFDRVETDHFIVKFDGAHDPGLGAFLGEYLERIYEPVTSDFQTRLSEKTVIEVFPTIRAFGVRITGKPWIHTVGACTGRVIALTSPRDLPLGNGYDIANVLKHEFTHTVTLDATRNRIPHWLTEGLAVYQEDSPRSFFWAEMLADAARRGELFTLETVNWGFIRPRRPNDRQMAYAQSEWMCEYLSERYGYDVFNEMLRRFREGQTQPQVFTEQLKIEPTAFDSAFTEWARRQVASWGFELTAPEAVETLRALADENPEDAAVLGRLARAELDAGEPDRALKAARKAIKLDEKEIRGLTVLGIVLSRAIAEAENNATRSTYSEEARPAMERLLLVDPEGWIAPKLLADIALRGKAYDRAVEMFERLQRLCPMDPASWRGLAGIHLERGDDERALSQLLELARMEEGDAEVPAAIGRIHRRRGRWNDAQHWFRRALYINPFSAELHEALGQTCMQAGDTDGALRAFTMLTRIEPAQARHFENAAFAANKLGDIDSARTFARKAVELDAESSARSLLP